MRSSCALRGTEEAAARQKAASQTPRAPRSPRRVPGPGPSLAPSAWGPADKHAASAPCSQQRRPWALSWTAEPPAASQRPALAPHTAPSHAPPWSPCCPQLPTPTGLSCCPRLPCELKALTPRGPRRPRRLHPPQAGGLRPWEGPRVAGPLHCSRDSAGTCTCGYQATVSPRGQHSWFKETAPRYGWGSGREPVHRVAPRSPRGDSHNVCGHTPSSRGQRSE